MRGFGSSSRFRFLYRCIVVSLYRFLVLALFQARPSQSFAVLINMAILERCQLYGNDLLSASYKPDIGELLSVYLSVFTSNTIIQGK